MKQCIVTSPGGHLYQAYLLSRWWRKHKNFWVTLPSPDVDYLLKKERVVFAFGPENGNVFNLIRNFFHAIIILKKESPDILFSTGAGLAPPFFWVAWFLGIKTVYLEPYEFINKPSMTARLVHPFTSIFLVQHKSLLRKFKKARYWGAVI